MRGSVLSLPGGPAWQEVQCHHRWSSWHTSMMPEEGAAAFLGCSIRFHAGRSGRCVCCAQPLLCPTCRISDWRGIRSSKVEKTATHSSDSKGHQQFGFTGTPPGAGDLCNYSTEQRHSPHTQSQAEMYSGFLTGYPICWKYFFLHQSAFSLVTVVAGVCHKQASKRKKKCPRELQCLENRLSESQKAFVLLMF